MPGDIIKLSLGAVVAADVRLIEGEVLIDQANTWLEGTYSEIYPHIPRNALGIQRLFKQFSFPGGIPSHAAPETTGSIREGGELGYAL